jgi:hypothetical protein
LSRVRAASALKKIGPLSMIRNERILGIALAISLLAGGSLARGDAPSDPLHNYANPLDVDANNLVSPRDALLIINELQKLQTAGSHSVTDLVSASAAATVSPAVASVFYWDTNTDGLVSPIDALLVINHLAQVPEPSTIITSGSGLLLLLASYMWQRKRART